MYIVYGGEIKDINQSDKFLFKSIDSMHFVGFFLEENAAYNAWKANAQRTVDNAHMRYFIKEL